MTLKPAPLRILHCPTDVGGNAYQLASAERALGQHSHVVAFQETWLRYPADEILFPPGTNRLHKEWRRYGLLWRALSQFDVIHFNFGSTITPARGREAKSRSVWHGLSAWLGNQYRALLELKDLPLLKRAGKVIAVTFQGDDARQGDFCLRHYGQAFMDELEPGYYTSKSDADKRRRVAVFDRYADLIYSVNLDLMNVLPARTHFVPYATVNLEEWPMVPYRPGTREVPLVVHAPTHRGIKGTRFILEAVSRLQAEGVRFQFRLVEKLAHAEARRLYEDADLLVDQILLGWYGGLGVELMALGKPIICNLHDGDMKFAPPAQLKELPIIRASPATVYEVLKECLTTRKQRLADIGRRGRSYVERWHDPKKIAARIVADYQKVRLTGKVEFSAA